MVARRPAGKDEGHFLLTLLVALGGLFVAVVAGAALAYVSLGITSVGYYGPPIGDVMAFAYNAALVSGAAVAAIFALLALLHQVPGVKERLDKVLKRF